MYFGRQGNTDSTPTFLKRDALATADSLSVEQVKLILENDRKELLGEIRRQFMATQSQEKREALHKYEEFEHEKSQQKRDALHEHEEFIWKLFCGAASKVWSKFFS